MSKSRIWKPGKERREIPIFLGFWLPNFINHRFRNTLRRTFFNALSKQLALPRHFLRLRLLEVQMEAVIQRPPVFIFLHCQAVLICLAIEINPSYITSPSVPGSTNKPL
jgi:hypothetical protein